MPTHWESSKRPLFVRTVFVNGNRHAILSQEDPLCQPNGVPSSRKQSRPSSCQSYTSNSSVNSTGSRNSNFGKRCRNSRNENWEHAKGDLSTELQGCLVKLRLVLATHDNKNKTRSENVYNLPQELRRPNQTNRFSFKQKRKKSNNPKNNKKKSCDYFRNDSRDIEIKETRHIELPGYRDEKNFYGCDNNDENNAENNFYYLDSTSEYSTLQCCCEKDASIIEIRDLCCLEGYHDIKKESEIIISKDPSHLALHSVNNIENRYLDATPTRFLPSVVPNDIPWNSISSDSYFTRPFYNPLSERVLQWLDLASKRRETAPKTEKPGDNANGDNIERIFEGSTFLDVNNISRYREKSRSKKNKMLRSKSEGKISKTDKSILPARREIPKITVEKRCESKEDADAEEVKREDDVETALSTEIVQHEYPKFTKELNKLHTSMSLERKSESDGKEELTITSLATTPKETKPVAIPEKVQPESDISAHLQESIMNSFTSVVTLKQTEETKTSENYTNRSFTTYQYFPQHKTTRNLSTMEKRSLLTRQSKLQESSDEDDDSSSLRARSIECWNRNQVNIRQRRNAFSHRNSMFNKTIECNNARSRRESMRRQKNRNSLQIIDKNNENQKPEPDSPTGSVEFRAVFHPNTLSPHLQNKIPWLRDYQTGGKNMWPSEKATNRPQLHIFMPAIPPKISESGTGEDSISDCESFASEVCS